MKKYFTLFLTLVSITVLAQQDTTANAVTHATYERHAVIAGISLGFIDNYKRNYSMPPGFEKSNTSGFVPASFSLEYGVTNSIGIAAIFTYDAFLYNFKQDYTGNSGAFTRYNTSNTRILTGGLVAFYHIGRFIPVKHLDPFIGIGLSLNNIRYGAYPQGDSTQVKFDHTVTPYLKVGARYYISSVFSLFGDAGYDQHTIFNLGFSCRFLSSKEPKRNK